MSICPRNEYPRPDLVRPANTYVCLNGEWDFAFDFGKSGRARGMITGGAYTHKITVPFAPESKLSGIEYTDFVPAVWYRRTFGIPTSFIPGESRLLLHFGAVDYRSWVWVNGQEAGSHRGGFTPFVCDITDLVTDGENTVTVYAEDDTRDPLQPTGKQSLWYENRGCHYTRSTGIWQTVWLEVVPRSYIASLRMTPDVKNEKLDIRVTLAGDLIKEETIRATALFEGEEVSEVSARITGRFAEFSLPVPSPKLWDLGQGNLYDIRFRVGSDAVSSYFGMRTVEWTDRAFLLNGRPVFQRLVLDQGYYPDGIYTAPTDDELRLDVERSMAVGFNGARLHMKIFEPRLLYWADKLGYMVWDEYPNWGLNDANPAALLAMLPEWLEEMERDYSHPSIVGWCPFNETGTGRNTEIFSTVIAATKAIDPIRPVIDTSGYVHGKVTDIYDVHDYTQDPAVMEAHLALLAEGKPAWVNFPKFESYDYTKPYFISECGGIYWNLDIDSSDPSWGYGEAPKTKEEFLTRLRGLCDAMLDSPHLFGFCYTQLTDVFQEKNGFYAFDRREKFDAATLHAIIARKAKIEE